jgi:hypothetical protein
MYVHGRYSRRQPVVTAVIFVAGVLLGTVLYGPKTACPASSLKNGIGVVIATTADEAWMENLAFRLGMRYGVAALSMYCNRHGYAFRPVFFAPELHGQTLVDKRINWNRLSATINACKTAEWVFFTETDVWVTNFDVRLEDIIARSTAAHADAVLVLTRDVLGGINTGSGFVRCSEIGVRALRSLLRMRDTHGSDSRVSAWGDQGAFMILAEQDEWKPRIAYAPQRAFSSYPTHVDDWTYFKQADADDAHFWSRGDFAIHFAGFYKGGLASFARELETTELRVGFAEHADVDVA